MNLEEIKKHIQYFMDDKYDREFYVALALHDILGIKLEQVTSDLVDNVLEIIDNYDSIYEEFLRYDLRDFMNGNYKSEEENECSLEN